MRLQWHAIFASVYSKQDTLWRRVWEPISRNIQELRDSTRISILLGSFRSVRRGLSRRKVPGIHYRVRSLICFVLELASATLSISRYCLLKLKPVSFAFHRDLQLRSAKKADVAIFRIEEKKDRSPRLRLACTHASFHETTLRKKNRRPIDFMKTRPCQFSFSNKIFRRNKRKIFW